MAINLVKIQSVSFEEEVYAAIIERQKSQAPMPNFSAMVNYLLRKALGMEAPA